MKSHTDVAEHFDAIAHSYDYWKEKNWYYYDALKRIAGLFSDETQAILDAGCGTGGIISTLSGRERVGIDISEEMIEIAKERHKNEKNLSFFASDILSFHSDKKFECILFFDVIEHLDQPEEVLMRLRELLSTKKGRLVVTMANPLWEPILLLGEKLGMKMPEGPHHRLSTKKFLELAQKIGLKLEQRDWKLLFPKYMPLFSYVCNDILIHIPFLKRLAVIEVFVFTR